VQAKEIKKREETHMKTPKTPSASTVVRIETRMTRTRL
jgi:hypothetical protein